MSFVHPIPRAWISTGGTGAQNYDEFADDAEITAIVADNPHSALGVEMPHCAPASLGRSFVAALPQAVTRLQESKDTGRYVAAQDVVGVYRITDPSSDLVTHGVFVLVDTDQISTSADEPGRVIRNEDVFVDKVRERVALAEATGHLLSPVLLLQTEGAAALQQELAQVAQGAGEAAVTDTDPAGRRHEVWPVTGEAARRICALAADGELVVADGNHRTLAAQTGGLDRFLAVVTTPEALTIQPYHRLVSRLPMDLTELVERLRAAGATVAMLSEDRCEPGPGSVLLYAEGQTWGLALPAADSAATVVDRLDHAVVEKVLLSQVLGLDPGDKAIRYIGGDYPVSWLRRQVDDGAAQLAVLIAPVDVEDFVQVNLDRHKMPRKSTWFTPKARAGLVLAELDADPA